MVSARYIFLGGGTWAGRRGSVTPPTPLAWDWSEANPPWAYQSEAEFTTDPAWSDATIVPLRTGGADFFANLRDTVDAAGKRVVVRLPEGVHRLTSFRPIGSSGDPTYAFGFWFPNLQGLLGAGPDKTFVQMDPGSVSAAQLDALDEARFAWTGFNPLQMGLARFDGTNAASPVLLAGLTFRAADQQTTWTKQADVPITLPQSAPHQGVVIYPGSHGRVSHVRFQAAGRALTSRPPFEMANANTQYGYIRWNRVEFDGRRSPDLDPTRPRRCAHVMVNNEYESTMTDCWLHHSNVSRYAANDENRDMSGVYNLTRVKVEQTANVAQPDLNRSNASATGWESSSASINLTDCILEVNNPFTSPGLQHHIDLTSVGNRNPQGGRLRVIRGTWRNTAFPHLDGFLQVRPISTTYWVRDGLDTTVNITRADGTRLKPWVYTGSWPPPAATLAAAGVTPTTHYLVRQS